MDAGECFDEINGPQSGLDLGLKEVRHGKPIREERALGDEGNLGGVCRVRRLLEVPNRFGTKGLAFYVVVDLLKKLLSDAAATTGAGAGGGVDGVDLSSLATVHDLHATHCGEDVVLHLLFFLSLPELNAK